jgi:predicted dehydrogenase
MPPNQGLNAEAFRRLSSNDEKLKVAILGTGMMGQEHISYISGYSALQIDFLCDPFEPSLDKAVRVMKQFNNTSLPTLLRDEIDLLSYADDIDLLVIASPNYLHTESLARWGKYNITILVEKPVAVSQEQHDVLTKLAAQPDFIARIWVAMEYRYIPAIAKLLSLIPTIGDLKMCTIRENRYPFLHKILAWNRDPLKTGDTLVEKCCHFFDLFRLITGKEISEAGVRSLAQRGLNYHDEPQHSDTPIVDAAYCFFPFREKCTMDESIQKQSQKATMGCLELCMYAEGSRHQEEIIVTGTKVSLSLAGARPNASCSVSKMICSRTRSFPVLYCSRAVWRLTFRRTRYTTTNDQTLRCGLIEASLRQLTPSEKWSLTVPTSRTFMRLRMICQLMADTTTALLLSSGTI